MKKMLLSIIITLTLITNVKASDWLEPTLFCAGLGGAGYLASKSNQVAIGGALCLVGIATGMLINNHYKEKYTGNAQQEISDLKMANKEFEISKAKKAAAGEDDSYEIRVKELVEGKKLDDGSILYPTFKVHYELPGQGARIGD